MSNLMAISSISAPSAKKVARLFMPGLSAAILAGGLVGALARRGAGEPTETGSSRGLLFAAGLVTGEALMGILLAVPIALTGLWPTLGADPFQLFETPPLGGWPGLLVLAAVAVLLHRTARARSY